MAQVQDFIPWLKDAVVELRQSGYNSEADELDGVLRAVWTSSSEMCGEIGIAIKKIKKNLKSKLPQQVKNHFDSSMKEIHKIWPMM